jgi:hypothetical protein
VSKRSGDPGYAAGWCIHYRHNRNPKTVHDNTCEAGVEYDLFKDQGKFPTWPCFLDEKGQSKPGALTCTLLRRPTTEEIAAHEKWSAERLGLLGKVMVGISSWRLAHKGKSAQEVVECPGCGGRLHLSISGYNGHVHGHCETAGCVSWME